jgi:toluene monooxygenase system protein E
MQGGRPPGRKTYTRIEPGRRRVPSEYEVVSTNLHYSYPHRFELPAGNAIVDWYERHREGSAFSARDWEMFADPRRTTYRDYNTLQDARENVIDGLLGEIDATGYDDDLVDDWVAFLNRSYAPLRFPTHGLQMLASYIAQMAPASRITNCASFQAGDELRRQQRIAYRTAQIADHRDGIDISAHRRLWEEADVFQPLRELIERALVCYDWGESFVATNLVIKPCVDRLINQELAGTMASANGDFMLRNIHFSLDEDARWHRDWSATLTRMAFQDTPTNRDVIAKWIAKWEPLAARAVQALAQVAGEAPNPVDPGAVTARVIESTRNETASLLDS